TGYPIARVAAKIAVGKTLDEIENAVTKTTKACFEPALDYCVVKIPRWPFDKFGTGDRKLFTQMKATGEVMAIDRTFESAFLKAIRGLEVKQKDLRHTKFQGGTVMGEEVPPMSEEDLTDALKNPTDERLWALAEALRRGWTVDRVRDISRVDRWFLRKIQALVEVEQKLVRACENDGEGQDLVHLVSEAFLVGFPSPTILDLLGCDLEIRRKGIKAAELVRPQVADQSRTPLEQLQSENEFRRLLDYGLEVLSEDERTPGNVFRLAAVTLTELHKGTLVFKMVDTCAGEFESKTPYYYGTFEDENDAALFR
ncbi:MAG: hypothetical protein ACOCX1_01085, partial [Fimbriimonadaceae bacterium]